MPGTEPHGVSQIPPLAAGLWLRDSWKAREDYLTTALFFAIAYLISWGAWIALYRLRLPYLAGAGLWIYIVAVLAPHAAAVTMTIAREGRAGLQKFYSWVF